MTSFTVPFDGYFVLGATAEWEGSPTIDTDYELQFSIVDAGYNVQAQAYQYGFWSGSTMDIQQNCQTPPMSLTAGHTYSVLVRQTYMGSGELGGVANFWIQKVG